MNDDEIKFYLKKVGLKKDQDIVEFWYSKPGVIRDKLDQIIPTIGQKIEKVIRWKTEDGKIALQQIRDFIKKTLEEKKRIDENNFKNGVNSFDRVIIDFNNVKIENMSINDYMYSKIKHYYSISGWNDLCGASLDGFFLQNAIIKNAVFSFGSFNNSTLQGLKFQNCNLSLCSFNNCHLSNVSVDENGSMSDCSWINSTLNVIEISSRNFGVNPNYMKIGYWGLIKIAFTGIVEKRDTRNYTDFSSCEIKNDNYLFQFREHSDYINWYQSTVHKYSKINEIENFCIKNYKRFSNVFNAISTKNWHSPLVTLLFGAFITFLFSFIYYFFRDLFENVDSYSKALNLSVHVFTTLGLSNMLPDFDKSEFGLWIISIECILGYVWLALTMMVFARKIFK